MECNNESDYDDDIVYATKRKKLRVLDSSSDEEDIHSVSSISRPISKKRKCDGRATWTGEEIRLLQKYYSHLFGKKTVPIIGIYTGSFRQRLIKQGQNCFDCESKTSKLDEKE